MKKIFLIFLAIFFLAIFLRIYQFGDIPHGASADEADLGYNAYLLLYTGKDEHGRFMPYRFESFGDWKRPLYFYLTILPVALFGLNIVSVRLISLLAALSLIPLVFLITQKILPVRGPTKSSALIAALLISFSPWHFYFSRVALEATLSVALFSWSFYFLVLKANNLKYYYAGLIFFSLSLFSYYGALVTLPLWLICYLSINRKKRNPSNFFVLGQASVVVLVIILFLNLFFTGEKVKAQGTSIFHLTNEEKSERIYNHRTNFPLSKIIHNQYVYYFKTFSQNYAQTFTAKFILTQGGSHPLFNLPGFGNFLLPEVMLAGLGIIWILKNPTKSRILLLALIFLAPIAGAITKDAVHTDREVFLLPATQIIAGIGTFWLLSQKKRLNQIIILAILTSVVFSALPFYLYYFKQYRQTSDPFYKGYLKDLSLYIFEIRNDYEKIIITFPFESPYIYYAFYNRLEPTIFLSQIEHFPVDALGFRHVQRLEKLYFVENNKPILKKSTKIRSNNLIFSRVEEIPSWIKPVKVWNNLEGKQEIVAWEEKQLDTK